MIFKSKTGRSAGGGQSELIDNLLPEFVMRDGLSAPLFAYGLIQFEKIELLTADLGYLDLRDTFGGPVLPQVLFKFVLLF
jgi:hypothetical protein